MNNEIIIIPGGAGFLPSTVSPSSNPGKKSHDLIIRHPDLVILLGPMGRACTTQSHFVQGDLAPNSIFEDTKRQFGYLYMKK